MKRKKTMLASKDMTVVEFARLGGLARASALTPEQRKEIASNAAKARWKRKRDLEGHS